MQEQQAFWYVVHTYSGYENKVKDNLDKTVENRGLNDLILEVRVPMEDVIEIKNGKKKINQRKMFPGYVLVKMHMTDDSWYIVRNTRGVTGFVGVGSKPSPLSDAEVGNMGMEKPPVTLDVEIGDHVRVLSGPLQDFLGTVEEVFHDRQKARVVVSMFGRETPVELDFIEIIKD